MGTQSSKNEPIILELGPGRYRPTDVFFLLSPRQRGALERAERLLRAGKCKTSEEAARAVAIEWAGEAEKDNAFTLEQVREALSDGTIDRLPKADAWADLPALVRWIVERAIRLRKSGQGPWDAAYEVMHEVYTEHALAEYFADHAMAAIMDSVQLSLGYTHGGAYNKTPIKFVFHKPRNDV